MIYLDKIKLKNSHTYKITHVNGDDVTITKYFNSIKDAEKFAEWYAKKRNCEVHNSVKKLKKK